MERNSTDIEQAKMLKDAFKQIEPQNIEKILQEYIEIRNIYNAAIKEVRTKLEILDDEFNYRYKRNPIHSIQSRLKKPNSIISKMIKKGFADFSYSKIKEEITDIAGIRVICQYIDDIFTIYDLLSGQSDVKVVKISDYINNPKENGYRSFHMIVNIPVFFSDRTEHVNVEIQIRTIAMDYWASLEHELKYKNPDNIPPFIKAKLLECAETIAETDYKMQEIYKAVSNIENQDN
jgi:putative GTP pyrophosphokinase